MLPQEFPRHLALLSLEDVLGDLPDERAREAYIAAFEARRADPLAPGGVVLHCQGMRAMGGDPPAVRLLMALMRLVVLRFRDLNLERFEQQGSEGQLLNAYVRGENLALPLPERARGLFIERADKAPPEVAGALAAWDGALYATWRGPAGGPVWAALTERCSVIKV
ncbi:MAG: hypothetical protein ACOY93_20595 [Bacillota bacterium]